MTGFTEHELRRELAMEAHARPFERLRAPARASHIALLTGEGAGEREAEYLAELCRRFDAPPPAAGATHHTADLGDFRCKWERHTEFTSYTFFSEVPFSDPFDAPVIELVPGDWLAGLEGKILVACHVALLSRKKQLAEKALQAHLIADSLSGSAMAGGNAEAWTDFRIHDDGFGRILVRDIGLRSRQAGRLVQRLLEIETYRFLALLALPLARQAGPEMGGIAGEHSAMTGRMQNLSGAESERAMLDELTGMAVRMEQLASRNNYRFRAAEAYYALVEKRIEGLRETRIEGLQTIREFMDRRMAPAMRTCQSVAARQDRLRERIGRTTALLRTRVEIGMEEQNRDLLRSMDRRARLQLRLQETVEGLSIAAISYYLVGLVGYAAKALRGAGLSLPVDLVTGLSIPVVVILVWIGMRRVRRRLTRNESATGH